MYFDTNGGTPDFGFWLGFDQSALDLAAIGAELHDGLVVIIYMPGELEMMATLHYGDRFGADNLGWWAAPIPDTLRYLDGS